MDRKLHLYVDFMSQPSRAVLIFCRVNHIDSKIHVVHVTKGETRTAEFKAINPMGQVPAIVDAGFKLFESHAILRYLACTRPEVRDHWYPADTSRRARIDSVLDWHHSNLRRGSAGMVMQLVVRPLIGQPTDGGLLKEAERILVASLKMLETVWLEGNGLFLANGLQPSIADLSLACEVKQLELFDPTLQEKLLGPHQKIQAWLNAVKTATSPHFEDVHKLLHKAVRKAQDRKLAAHKLGDDSTQIRSKL